MASRDKKSKSNKARAITKAQLASALADATGVTKAQAQAFFTAQAEIVGKELKAGRPVSIPGLVKVTLHHKAATAARPGRNPFTGADMMFKAKPARRVVRVRPLKALKDVV